MDEERFAYTGFAGVYDKFMEEIPYREWLVNIRGILEEYEIRDGLVLELGCGTGTFTELMSQSGYDMIGVDNSADMLEAAMEKRDESGSDILYLMQDMREFELYGTVRAVVSVCDSMNYLSDTEELTEVLRLVNNYLDPAGIFVFDLKTAHYFRDVCGDCVMSEDREEGTFIWVNSWYEEEQTNEYDLTLFIREESGLYRKEEETHFQRAFSVEEIREAVEASGMEFLGIRDAVRGGGPDEESERLYVIAREKGKMTGNAREM